SPPSPLSPLLPPTAVLSSLPIPTAYAHLSLPSVLRAFLPPHLHAAAPSSFESVGSIAHVNLRPEYLPYKLLIGRALLDKTPAISKVVNKIAEISSQFRTFPMEVIAGADDGDFVTTLREGGVRFRLDFSRVYWNSRLQYEHRRLVDLILGKEHGGSSKKSSTTEAPTKRLIVADAMAGIGPFAIPLGLENPESILANDLNPDSFKYLQENIILNKVSSAVTPSCLDGREFIHSLMSRAPSKTPSHVIMNLPATAVEFLDAFRSWPAALPPPTVHVYCFVKCQSLDASDAEAKIRPRVEAALGCAAGELAVHLVRDVAPKKPMCCVSFRLPEADDLSTIVGKPGDTVVVVNGYGRGDECELVEVKVDDFVAVLKVLETGELLPAVEYEDFSKLHA
ncbi:hypothetical protein TeGR_g14110, partial [Tetraparma gracilis]